jgi:hypothetical protein
MQNLCRDSLEAHGWSRKAARADWSLEPKVRFSLPEQRLSPALLGHLNSLDAKHPILRWL